MAQTVISQRAKRMLGRFLLGLAAILFSGGFACAGSPAPLYGLFSIANTQSLRLILFNGSSDKVQASCSYQVTLLDDTGASQGMVSGVLSPGQIAVLNKGDFGSTAPTTAPSAATTATHASLRPVIAYWPPDPCREVVSTFEIVDMATGETSLIAGPTPYYPPDPCLRFALCGFGFSMVTSDVNVRLTVVNAANPMMTPKPGACNVTVSFVDPTGNVMQSKMASLGPGQSVTVEQQGSEGGALLHPKLSYQPPSYAPPDPCLMTIPTVEVVDVASDQTRYFWPLNPQPSPPG